MTADVKAPPVLEYGVHAFHRDHARHEVTACTDLAEALTTLTETCRHVDAWAALVWRTPAGEWRRVGPDDAATAYYTRQEAPRA